VVQHDAVLATLALLQPPAQADPAEQRLPALYAQILRVQRRDRDASWPDPRQQAAEVVSRAVRHPALSQLDFSAGRYELVLAAEPASFALLMDLRAVVPWSEWPMQPRSSPVRVALEQDGQSFVLQPGRSGGWGWRFDFDKHLASGSQPFNVVASRVVGPGELPWLPMLAWSLAAIGLLAGLRAWQGQRQARQRAEELLRLGQVSRLNALGELATRQVAPVLHGPAEPLSALAEPVALEQILHNLLMNALQALEQVPPTERQLALTLSTSGDRAQVEVADSGPGIAPEHLPRLFEPFFSTRENGLGLGLSLCESLALGMGGRLTAGTNAPRGAVFRLSLRKAPA